MEPAPEDDHIKGFVIELLSTGSMLLGLIEDLADGLSADAYPDEEPRDVVVEMVYGTIATALEALDPDEVRSATELIDLAGQRVLAHLQLACELSRRMQRGQGGLGRTYG